ncbi:hypothetical protein S1OALGB6SA_1179 [Olavius algarvensis spirochete endosymbiont]|uniref:DUF1697 domain-containing protein n=1 Tax=Olavius algarvensis spirochete endosymbiont TaxID=260710 RepID=UPI000F20C30C|nr:DUF1697 domain-containing protein [Olavius algarvensis spirochete endosymbiont]CAD7838074.1 MAG: hypothetical protein [Olavius algarvensis spirochete endosymbiont]VDB00105.1 hypothetical protein S1OALGB6SA_1179 [Olavius algarvensis spirochete endosymbiont]
MTRYIALLRAVNVGGTGKLSMKTLSDLCIELGLENVRTYIQSGNIVFDSNLAETAIRRALEEALADKLEIKTEVVLRTAKELKAVLDANPFSTSKLSGVGVFFQTSPINDRLFHPSSTEEIRMGEREVYIHFKAGMASSKLKLPTRMWNHAQYEHGFKSCKHGWGILNLVLFPQRLLSW